MSGRGTKSAAYRTAMGAPPQAENRRTPVKLYPVECQLIELLRSLAAPEARAVVKAVVRIVEKRSPA